MNEPFFIMCPLEEQLRITPEGPVVKTEQRGAFPAMAPYFKLMLVIVNIEFLHSHLYNVRLIFEKSTLTQ